jgi:hypothetical protein
MKIKKILFSLSLLALILSSCSIEKRVHSNGYHMDWNTNSSRLQQKELTLTKKHKTFNRFELNGQDHQDNTKPISSLNGGALKTAENKPKTVKTPISRLDAFPKVSKIMASEEIKPNTTDDEEEKEDKAPIVGIVILVIAVVIAFFLLGGGGAIFGGLGFPGG